jgi:hypothetical protein
MYTFNIINIYIHIDTYNNAVNQNKLSIKKITTTLKYQYIPYKMKFV